MLLNSEDLLKEIIFSFPFIIQVEYKLEYSLFQLLSLRVIGVIILSIEGKEPSMER